MGLVILSLFDGYSGGQEALKRLGFKIDKYFASEIDKYAIGVTQYNHPGTIQIGDVTKVRYENGILYTEKGNYDVPRIDAVIGGSPCQGFSFAGKQLNFNDPRSKLFFEWLRICHEVCPRYFFLENVRMKKEYEAVINDRLGVNPVFLDSNLVSAQNRKRLYWTNIEGYIQPQDKGILLKDIIHENESGFVFVDKDKSNAIIASIGRTTHREYYQKSQGQMVYEGLIKYIVPFDKTLQILEKEVEKGKVGYFRKDSQANRVYYIHGKAITLCGDSGGGAAKMGQYLFGCITPDRVEKRQNGQRFNNGNKFYTLTAQDKHGILIEGYIRKLTPIECERLQTLPDNYTKYGIINGKTVEISDSQRYKMLGNGWTVDAITEFFKHIEIDL